MAAWIAVNMIRQERGAAPAGRVQLSSPGKGTHEGEDFDSCNKAVSGVGVGSGNGVGLLSGGTDAGEKGWEETEGVRRTERRRCRAVLMAR